MSCRSHPAPAGPALSFHDLSIGYGRRPALANLNGAVARGELLALVGPNGAGKSTILKAIVGEAALLAGRLERHGARVRDIAYLPQRAEIDRSFPITVADFVSMGLWRRTGAWRGIGPSGRAEVEDALARVGLPGFARRVIGSLSGGEMQRVLFARTLLQDCRLILLDEPFAAMDERTTGDLLDLVGSWRGEGRTVLAALHDLDQVRAVFPSTLLLGGRSVPGGSDPEGAAPSPIAWGPTASVLTRANLDREPTGSGPTATRSRAATAVRQAAG